MMIYTRGLYCSLLLWMVIFPFVKKSKASDISFSDIPLLYYAPILKETTSQELFQACASNDIKKVKKWLSMKVLPTYRVDATFNYIDKLQVTGLQYACYKGYKEIVQLFFNEEYELDLQDQLPIGLYLACNNNKRTIVELLLEKKVSIDYTDTHGHTAFQRSCWHGCKEIVELFFEQKYCHTALNKQLFKAFYSACLANQSAIVELFLNKKIITIDATDEEGKTAFQSACYWGNKKTIELFLKNKYYSRTLQMQLDRALYEACEGNKPHIVKLLLEKKARINYRDHSTQKTGFEHACCAKNTAIFWLFLQAKYCWRALQGQFDRALYEVCKGSDNPLSELVNDITSLLPGYQTTHHISIIEALLKRKALLNYRDNDGKTAFLWSCEKGKVEVLHLFFKHEKEMKKNLMKKHLCVIEHMTRKERKVLSIDILRLISSFIVQEIDRSQKDKEGNTALHLAALKGHDQAVQLLLEHGFDPMALNKRNETPVNIKKRWHYAQRYSTKSFWINDH